MTKLIIIRGNSGSGKSTTAKIVREKLDRNIALVEQDYLRRIVLKEKSSEGDNHFGLIEQTVIYCLDNGYDVILEGIFHKKYYSALIDRLLEHNKENYLFYFDVSLEETIKRHDTKPNKHEFGEKEIREWYNPDDWMGYPNEKIISEDMSQEESVNLILKSVS